MYLNIISFDFILLLTLTIGLLFYASIYHTCNCKGYVQLIQIYEICNLNKIETDLQMKQKDF